MLAFSAELFCFLGVFNDGCCSAPSFQPSEREGRQKTTREVRMKRKSHSKSLTRLSGTSGSPEHCDITVVKNPLPVYACQKLTHSTSLKLSSGLCATPLVWNTGAASGWLIGPADLREKSKPEDGINTEKLSWVEIEPPGS